MEDWANPAQLNCYDWYSADDGKVPYPGDSAILAPSQVPGALRRKKGLSHIGVI